MNDDLQSMTSSMVTRISRKMMKDKTA